MTERLLVTEVDVCPLCGWATTADGSRAAICPYHDKRCERIAVRIPAATERTEGAS